MLLMNRFCKYVHPISKNNSLASKKSLQAATHLVLKHSRLLYIIQLDNVCNCPFALDMHICYLMDKLLMSITKLINLSILKIIFQN